MSCFSMTVKQHPAHYAAPAATETHNECFLSNFIFNTPALCKGFVQKKCWAKERYMGVSKGKLGYKTSNALTYTPITHLCKLPVWLPLSSSPTFPEGSHTGQSVLQGVGSWALSQYILKSNASVLWDWHADIAHTHTHAQWSQTASGQCDFLIWWMELRCNSFIKVWDLTLMFTRGAGEQYRVTVCKHVVQYRRKGGFVTFTAPSSNILGFVFPIRR